MFWVRSVYFNLMNILPKSGTFLRGHPIYIYIYIHTDKKIFFLRNLSAIRRFRRVSKSIPLAETASSEFSFFMEKQNLQKPLCTLELSDVSIIYSRSEIHLPTTVPEQFRAQSNSAVCKSWNPPERLWSRDTVTASDLLCSLSENTEHSLRH